tara:strand:- start:1 stop:207 length:207 start_codon:yes stop_codon:yes gene_type:complete
LLVVVVRKDAKRCAAFGRSLVLPKAFFFFFYRDEEEERRRRRSIWEKDDDDESAFFTNSFRWGLLVVV